MSDLQLSQNITPASETSRYVKNGLSIKPYPFDIVKKSEPIWLYYEIYNLKRGRGGWTSYQVEYAVRIIKEKESVAKAVAEMARGILRKKKMRVISTSYRRSGNETNPVEYITLDFGALPEGWAELTVTDLNATATAESHLRIKLVD